MDPSEKRRCYFGELKTLGLAAAGKVLLCQSVAEMLDSENTGGQGDQRHSSLSAAAQAHRLGINSFVTRDVSGGVRSLMAPRAVVLEIAIPKVGRN